MTPEVRKVETEYHETGVAQTNRVETTYEIGVEIDGVWVRFATARGPSPEAVLAAAAAATKKPAKGKADDSGDGE